MAPTRIPGIPYAGAPRAEAKAAALAWPPRLVVIHDTGNPRSSKEAEASYASTRTDLQSRWTSAHAYIDNGGALGSLRLDRQAWAAYAYANAHGIHLELCLVGDRAVTRRVAAQLTARLCDLAGIPKVKLTPQQVGSGFRGVCGHRDVTIGLGVGDHTDPGPDFPWSTFMTTVTGAAGGATTGAGMDLNTPIPEPLYSDFNGGDPDDAPTGLTVGQMLAQTHQHAWYARSAAGKALEIAKELEARPAATVEPIDYRALAKALLAEVAQQ